MVRLGRWSDLCAHGGAREYFLILTLIEERKNYFRKNCFRKNTRVEF